MAIYHKMLGIKANLLGKGKQWQHEKEAMYVECGQLYFGLEHHYHFAKKCYDKVCLNFNYIIRGKLSIISMEMHPKGKRREMTLDCRHQCRFQLHLRSRHP